MINSSVDTMKDITDTLQCNNPKTTLGTQGGTKNKYTFIKYKMKGLSYSKLSRS